MSQSESYDYLIFRITSSFLNRYLGTLDCSRALLTRNSRGPSRTVLDFGLKGEIPRFCLVLWLVPLLSIGPSRTVDSVRDSIPSLRGCCAVSNLRRKGRAARGFLEWNCLTRICAFFNCDDGSQEFSELGYPFHLIRYWTPFYLELVVTVELFPLRNGLLLLQLFLVVVW